ncbi:tripartite tricarboxylate transporter substrate binding protein [Dankookia rubra]|uniref:Tripartite tricarboxylate transporter substrate binding protein n=1 Tax=Dankookia rubra TaxID=1442381 RepID=A0A4R5Q9N8_9PROT|nr:tripartite tricarboxylate transporter substrate-binding protein [Dankookia rubra]TDH58907.1 tripartite tricarboxylate transporter substrate binding protein [Dankookia rubra]
MPPIARRALLAGAAALPCAAQAQVAPLRMVVPFAPGGATDIAARLVVPALAEALARPVVIENRGGGGTLIGAEAVATAVPDGSTIGFFTITTAALAPALHPKLRFDIRRAFSPLSLVGTMPMLLVAGPHLPARTLPEFLALLRDSPRPLTYGSAGPGSINHLSAHMLAMRAGGRAEHVPYRGAALAVPDLVAGNVDFLVEGIASLHPHVRAGALRGLAVTGEARSALLPEVPTATEAGLPGFRILNWFAAFAPAGTPVPPLEAGLQRAVRSEAVAARLVENGIDPQGSDAAALARFWDAEIALWRPVVQAAGVTLD